MQKFFNIISTFLWIFVFGAIVWNLAEKKAIKKHGPQPAPTTVPAGGSTILPEDEYHIFTFDVVKAKKATSLTLMTPKQTGTQWHLWVSGSEYWFNTSEEVNEVLTPLGKIVLPGPPRDDSISGLLSRTWRKFGEAL